MSRDTVSTVAAPVVARELERVLGVEIRELEPVRGGDICTAFKATRSDGQPLFVKTHPDGAAMFEAEAAGLRWLQQARALAIPEVLAVGVWSPPLLVLAYVRQAAPARDYDEQLGRGLAALHRAGGSSNDHGYGFDADNFIGPLPQSNDRCATWPEFYWQRRLQPLLARATARGHLDAHDVRGFERLAKRLPDLVGDPEPPARLHGDLWRGNAISDEHGRPVLIDPSVYAGHREIDLAMMRLFGGFGARCFAAYEELWPLQPEAGERVPLYQLYPLLVHVNLFGSGYVGQLRATLRALSR